MYDTPQSRRSTVYHTPLSQLYVEYIPEYLAKIKIVLEYLQWDQKELFAEKPTLKILCHCPFNFRPLEGVYELETSQTEICHYCSHKALFSLICGFTTYCCTFNGPVFSPGPCSSVFQKRMDRSNKSLAWTWKQGFLRGQT